MLKCTKFIVDPKLTKKINSTDLDENWHDYQVEFCAIVDDLDLHKKNDVNALWASF